MPVERQQHAFAERIPHRLVPRFATRILLAGCRDTVLADALRSERGAEVYGVSFATEASPSVRERFAGFAVVGQEDSPLPFPPRYFDCIVLEPLPESAEALHEIVERLVPFLAPDGWMLIPVGNPGYWKAQAGILANPAVSVDEAEAALAGTGVYTFGRRVVDDRGVVDLAFPEAYSIEIAGHVFRTESMEALEQLATWAFVLVAIPEAYSPVAHARALFERGHPDWSHDLLSLIPTGYLQSPDVDGAIAAEMQLCMLAADVQDSGRHGSGDPLRTARRLERFWNAQIFFYRTTALFPREIPPYLCQAQFWRRLGNDGMAGRILRCIQSVAPNGTVAGQLAKIGMPAPPAEKRVVPPRWEPGDRPLRVLFLIHPRPHYELDVLYDGLCAVLGADAVVEYPWKKTLHGEVRDEFRNYPCTFDRPGTRIPMEDLLAQLREGHFDLVLFGDMDMAMPPGMARAFVEAAGNTPVFLVDGEDDMRNNRPALLDYLGVASVAGYFKREMLAGVDYGPNAFPLPFAYADGRIPRDVDGERPHDLFWAGNRVYGLRRLYLEHVEERFGRRLDAAYTQEEYAEALLTHRIGLSFPGFGYDTVRYWELPAHGCMLLSERLPMVIPYDFEDGKSAVFFDDVDSLDERLGHYLTHLEEASAIARAGRAHLLEHHTGEARARHLLGWVSGVIRGFQQ